MNGRLHESLTSMGLAQAQTIVLLKVTSDNYPKFGKSYIVDIKKLMNNWLPTYFTKQIMVQQTLVRIFEYLFKP